MLVPNSMKDLMTEILLLKYHHAQGLNFIVAIPAIAIEGEQNAVDHCGNNSNFFAVWYNFYTIHCALLF
jgi:hypothetical protein